MVAWASVGGHFLQRDVMQGNSYCLQNWPCIPSFSPRRASGFMSPQSLAAETALHDPVCRLLTHGPTQRAQTQQWPKTRSHILTPVSHLQLLLLHTRVHRCSSEVSRVNTRVLAPSPPPAVRAASSACPSG